MGSGYSTTTFAFNGLGLLTSTTDALGRVEDFLYDGQDRLTQQTWYQAGGTIVYDRLTATYDANGNMLTAANSAGTYTMSYNADSTRSPACSNPTTCRCPSLMTMPAIARSSRNMPGT